MSERPHCVHVVVDLHYGERIRDLPEDEPAWVVDSPDNHPIVQALRREDEALDQFTGITSFKCNPDDRPEDLLISILSAVNLHHGEYSHDPPYSILDVIGTPWSDAIQAELDQFQFFEHEATPGGFVARRAVRKQPAARE